MLFILTCNTVTEHIYVFAKYPIFLPIIAISRSPQDAVESTRSQSVLESPKGRCWVHSVASTRWHCEGRDDGIPFTMTFPRSRPSHRQRSSFDCLSRIRCHARILWFFIVTSALEIQNYSCGIYFDIRNMNNVLDISRWIYDMSWPLLLIIYILCYWFEP